MANTIVPDVVEPSTPPQVTPPRTSSARQSSTPPPAYSAQARQSPPPPTHAPPEPPKMPAPVRYPSPDRKNFSRPTLTVQTHSPPRTPSPHRQSSMLSYNNPQRPMSYALQRPASYMPPPNGRPRDDIPYDSPATMHAPSGYPTLAGQNRRTTVYFDSTRSSRESIMSYDSRHEKQRSGVEEKKSSGCWQSFALCFACCCCAELLLL